LAGGCDVNRLCAGIDCLNQSGMVSRTPSNAIANTGNAQNGWAMFVQAFYEQEVVKAFDELTHESSARSFWRVRAEAP
jgi:hypothetical protein